MIAPRRYWTDYQAAGQTLGTGDGTTATFQLLKRYPSGSEVESRTITKPVAGTVRVSRDGIEATTGWSVDATTGLVSFTTAPAAGVVLTADFEFDLPARFDTDRMEITLETYELGSWGQIPVVELRI